MPPGATRLNGWQSVWLGEGSGFYRSVFSVPSSCQTGPGCGILDSVAELDAGVNEIKAGGGRKVPCTAIIPVWIPLIIHRQTPGVIHLPLLSFIPNNLVPDGRHVCVRSPSTKQKKRGKSPRRHSSNCSHARFSTFPTSLPVLGPVCAEKNRLATC